MKLLALCRVSSLAAGCGGAFPQMLRTAGLAETLRGVGPYTVFAPTDAAFEALPEDVRARLGDSARRERLVALLS
jgi:uncharacterized surface protein with fasciclin (FAS1) repeats